MWPGSKKSRAEIRMKQNNVKGDFCKNTKRPTTDDTRCDTWDSDEGRPKDPDQPPQHHHHRPTMMHAGVASSFSLHPVLDR
jgi:hypothetical protein